ncbi:hypothetical protein [Ligilactobacillus equi]|nr:hypothetical protein [Ligilactobacillus equi]KRL78248.1 hypothetical protein FC36_GL001136 [Ligilactobacillus equi DSM 15833 = JCM 10991]
MNELESIGSERVQVINHKMDKLIEKDLRKTILEVYLAFEISEVYSESAYQLIIYGKRNANNENTYRFLIDNLNIMDLYTYDYSERDLDALKDDLAQTGKRNGVLLDVRRIAQLLDLSQSNISRAVKMLTKTTCSMCEVADLNLVSKDGLINTVTNTPYFYRKITNKVMRALAHNGRTILTQEELAERTGLDLEKIKHPELFCRNKDEYFDALAKIQQAVVPYDLDWFGKRGTQRKG